MNRSLMSLLSPALVAILLCITANSQSAQADWSDNFDGGLQQAWQFGSFDALGGSSATFNASSVGDQLVVTDQNSIANGGAAVAFGIVGELFTDVRMTGIINPNGDPGISKTVTLLARGNLFSGQFYAAEINYNDQELLIFRNDSPTETHNLIQTPIIGGLTTDDSVYLDFVLIGDSMTAKAYDGPGGSLLASVSTTDSNYAGGLSGIVVNDTDPMAQMLGVYDDITAATIPEPTTSLLALFAVSAALVAGRQQRRR